MLYFQYVSGPNCKYLLFEKKYKCPRKNCKVVQFLEIEVFIKENKQWKVIKILIER